LNVSFLSDDVPLPEAGTSVLVKGQVDTYAARRQYMFVVGEIRAHRTTVTPPPVSVSALTQTLRTTIEVHSCRAQGEISEVLAGDKGYILLKIGDATSDDDIE